MRGGLLCEDDYGEDVLEWIASGIRDDEESDSKCVGVMSHEETS